MKEKVLKITLPFIYVFSIFYACYVGVNYYNDRQAQKKRLLTINKTLEIQKTGESVKLELNSQNKDQQVTYDVKDKNVVKVSETGNLISVGEGTTTVTVTNKERTKSQTFVVSVGEEAIKEINKNEEKVEQLIEENKVEIKPTVNNNTNNSTTKPQTNTTTNKNNSTTKPQTNTNDNKNNSTTKPQTNTTTNKNNSTINKTVKVTGITLNGSSSTEYLNNTNSIKLTATVKPSNAKNKTITWRSSNTNVATVSNGEVFMKNPGKVVITATTSDGGYEAKYTLTIKKRIVIVVGASQVERMKWYKSSYASSRYKYNTSNGSLVYVANSGSGIDYQTGDGFTQVSNTVKSYSGFKSYVSFYIYFPIPGNTIKNFSCNQISSSNSTIVGYAKKYNSSIQSLKDSGYTVKGYVVSSHPVRVSQGSNKYVVTNENSNACSKGYRSNWKYFTFNKAIKPIIESSYSNNLKYQSLFIKIMETNNNQKNFSYKITYNTTDGIHWDEATTKTYVDMMLGYSNDL